MGDLTRSSG
uniref:Uncharacterized protein n=1 Tax=Zea mays TaxID=4577 RepID=C4J7K6_MAIZE|nr:unknown [Zea mays]